MHFLFSGDRSTELVPHTALRLPRNIGVWSFPYVRGVERVLIMKTIFNFLEDTGDPARCLVLYFLGLLLRILLLQTLGNRGSTAESTPPFYATTYSLYQELRDA